MDERRAADFFQKNNNYDFKKCESSRAATVPKPALGPRARPLYGRGDGGSAATASNRFIRFCGKPRGRGHGGGETSSGAAGREPSGGTVRTIGLRASRWARTAPSSFPKGAANVQAQEPHDYSSVGVELGKDRPEPSLTHYVDARK